MKVHTAQTSPEGWSLGNVIARPPRGLDRQPVPQPQKNASQISRAVHGLARSRRQTGTARTATQIAYRGAAVTSRWPAVARRGAPPLPRMESSRGGVRLGCADHPRRERRGTSRISERRHSHGRRLSEECKQCQVQYIDGCGQGLASPALSRVHRWKARKEHPQL